MNINIKATNIDLTDDLRNYVEEKLSSLTKYFNNIIEINAEVGMDSLHHQKGEIFFCEANIKVPNNLLRVRKEEKTAFKAVDKTKDHLRVVLHRHKEKIQGRKGGEKMDIEDIREIEEE